MRVKLVGKVSSMGEESSVLIFPWAHNKAGKVLKGCVATSMLKQLLKRYQLEEDLKHKLNLILRPLMFLLPLLLVPATANQAIAQTIPSFSSYTNNHFTIKYPSDWSINDTGFTNRTVFKAPNDTAEVGITWGASAPSWFLDREAWFSNMTKNGFAISAVTNNTNYLSRSHALVWMGTIGDIKEVAVVSVVRGTGYIITYAAGINNYLKYLNQAEIMWATFHLKT